MKSLRKNYIDNLRWGCILLLIPFHAAMAWNSWGEGNYIWFNSNKCLSTFIMFISPWYMPLLFILAGMSAKYSLNKRTESDFIKERIKKLLIPFFIGMVTIVAGMTYYADKFNNNYSGSFFSHYGTFFTKFTDLTGYDGGWTPAHLWFILYLFIISILSLGIIWIQKRFFYNFSCKNIRKHQIYLLGMIPIIATPILNVGEKSIGMYMSLYLIGYYVFAEDVVIEKIAICRVWNLVIMIVADIIDIYLFIWHENDNSIVNSINSIMMYITLWFGILTIIGFARKEFNFSNSITRYFSAHSYKIYIIHFIWIVVFQFYISKAIENIGILYIIPVVLSYFMTILTCEILENVKKIIKKLYKWKKYKCLI